MRYVWLAVAFMGTLALGLLVGIILGGVGGGGGEQRALHTHCYHREDRSGAYNAEAHDGHYQ